MTRSGPAAPRPRPRPRLTLLGLVLLGLGAAGCGGDPEPSVAPDPAPAAAPASLEGQVLRERPCPTAAEPFEPASVDVPDVATGLDVVLPARVSPGVPGTPSTDAAGTRQVAYDREQGVEPGDPRGNVLLNAHTFPDGSALGNRLLARLEEGGRVVLRGEGRELCYRVTERVEVPADQPFPRYYDDRGRPQVAIVVCSGERLGPGVWTERTVWFASPRA